MMQIKTVTITVMAIVPATDVESKNLINVEK